MTSRLTMSSSKPLLYFCLVVLLSCGQSINAQTNATTHPPEGYVIWGTHFLDFQATNMGGCSFFTYHLQKGSKYQL
ncbi:hypothetical protein V6Z11_A10G053600 [Gossypium hirsutum]